MASASKGPGADDLDALFTKTTKQLRNAAKACRIGKGGVACAVLDVAAAVIDNVQALSATIPVDDDVEEVRGAAEPSPTVEKAAVPAGGTAPAKSMKEEKKPTTPEAGDGDGV